MQLSCRFVVVIAEMYLERLDLLSFEFWLCGMSMSDYVRSFCCFSFAE